MKFRKYFFFLLAIGLLLLSFNNYQKEEKMYQQQQTSIKIKKPKFDIPKPNIFDNAKVKDKYTFSGIGLLILPNKLKLNIKDNSSKKTLDSLAVGLIEESSDLDTKNGVVIIAGHNMKKVFSYLHKIKKNENIIIYTKRYRRTYKVNKKMIIDETDFSQFKKDKKAVLYLITCTQSEHQRLLVQALLDQEEKLS